MALKEIIINCDTEHMLPFESDGICSYTTYISMRDYIKFSNESNVRKAKKNKIVNSMRETIETRPGMFGHKNNGANIIVHSIKKKSDTQLKVFMADGDGINNGGHTQLGGIETLNGEFDGNLDDAKVRVTLILGKDLTKEQRVDLATALNSSTKPKDSTLINAVDGFECFKKYMSSENQEKIIWKQNSATNKASQMDIDAYVNLFGALCPEARRPSAKKNGKVDIMTKTKLLAAVSESRLAYQPYYVLANDVCNLHDYILLSFNKMYNKYGKSPRPRVKYLEDVIDSSTSADSNSVKKTIFTNDDYTYNLATILIELVMYGLSNALKVKNENGVRTAYWVVEPKTLIDFCEKELWEQIALEAHKGFMLTGQHNLHGSVNRNPALWTNVSAIFANAILKLTLAK